MACWLLFCEAASTLASSSSAKAALSLESCVVIALLRLLYSRIVMASEAIGYFGAPNPVAGSGPSPLAAHFAHVVKMVLFCHKCRIREIYLIVRLHDFCARIRSHVACWM